MAHHTAPSAIPDALTKLRFISRLRACSPASGAGTFRLFVSNRLAHGQARHLPAPRKLSERVTAWNVGELRKALTK